MTAASTDACEAVSDRGRVREALTTEKASDCREGLPAEPTANPVGDCSEDAPSTVIRAYSSTSRTGRRVFRSSTSLTGMEGAGVEARAGAEANGGKAPLEASPLARADRFDADRGRPLSPG